MLRSASDSRCSARSAADDGRRRIGRAAGQHQVPAHRALPVTARGLGSDGRAMLPGTDALQLKYKGTLPALLEARTDLTPEAMKEYVRRGSWSMPPFRKTELTDRDIKNIAAYLATAPKK